MFAFAVGLMSPKTRVLFALYILFGIFVQTRMHALESNLSKNALLLGLVALVELAFFVGAFVFVRRLASWHGAEHMTIAAYERNGSIDVGSIEKESPINPRCGGRLALPLLLTSTLAVVLSKELGMSVFLFSIPLFEVVLQVDALKGFDKITPFSQASTLLQRYVTTKRPGALEVATGQTALLSLLDAHHTA